MTDILGGFMVSLVLDLSKVFIYPSVSSILVEPFHGLDTTLFRFVMNKISLTRIIQHSWQETTQKITMDL